ncbi:hypothetical protein [Flavobacterium rhizosphaerae]|uniref:Uncharacterized protein n=1 Tax=Flavobacterium rhizosphaerae TaxID=3163298 RepID=A0ABW8YYR1_9FLAO
MHIEGGLIEGFKYGGLSPLDFGGLAAWYKSTDGVDLAFGNLVTQWNDLSGNNRHLDTIFNLVDLTTLAYSPRLYNTDNGLGIRFYDSRIVMGCSTDLEFKKMLYDGRPMTMIIVVKINSYLGAANINFISTGSQHFDYGSYRLSLPTPTFMSSGVRKGTYSSATTILSNSIGAANVPPLGNNVISVIDTGYTPANNHRFLYINDPSAAKTSGKFSESPPVLSDNYLIEIKAGEGNYLYEIIMYDNTGKSQAQILDEHTRLYNEYIAIRYPNLYN